MDNASCGTLILPAHLPQSGICTRPPSAKLFASQTDNCPDVVEIVAMQVVAIKRAAFDKMNGEAVVCL